MLVTNVGQGFGRAIALAYGRAGYDVVCADRDVDLASKTAAELEELDGQAIPIQADMTTQMDVLAAYHKVMEIFGELGGVVHIAGHVSTTPFENLAEGEFFELMSEDVRSSYLVLKTAARLLSVGWVALVAPPDLGSVQMLSVQGALERMVEGFTARYAFPRANLLIPSRQASDPRHDQALVRAVRYFGSPESAGVSGQVMRVELPPPPSATDSLLPEVRAALDLSAVQDLGRPDYWDPSREYEEGQDAAVLHLTRADSALRSAYSVAASHGGTAGSAPGPLAGGGDDDWPAFGRLAGEPAAGFAAGAGEPIDDRDPVGPGDPGGFDDYADDDALAQVDPYEEDDAYVTWGREFGLPPGAPALRHLIGAESLPHPAGDNYSAGIEAARDLYGDLSRLEVGDIDELFDIENRGDVDPLIDGEDAKDRHRT